MIAQNPFAQPGRWFRGNLHMHTTESDSARSPAEAVAWDRVQGYDFVSATDHVTLTETSHLQTPDFPTLPGIEYHGDDLDLGHYHVIAIGMGAEPPPFAPAAPLQSAIDAFRARDAFVSIAHSYWYGQSACDLLIVNNYHAIEMFNATCRALNDKGLSSAQQITFIGDRWHGRPLYAAPGATLTEAEYQLNGAQRYLRVECSDGRGGRAWSLPFFLDGDR